MAGKKVERKTSTFGLEDILKSHLRFRKKILKFGDRMYSEHDDSKCQELINAWMHNYLPHLYKLRGMRLEQTEGRLIVESGYKSTVSAIQEVRERMVQSLRFSGYEIGIK